jgi:hypothetical protein
VRRHIVRSLDLVNPAGIGRRNAFERRGEVGAHVRISVLLDDQGRRRMFEKKQQGAVTRANFA